MKLDAGVKANLHAALDGIYEAAGTDRPHPTIVTTTVAGQRIVITAGAESPGGGIDLPDADAEPRGAAEESSP